MKPTVDSRPERTGVALVAGSSRGLGLLIARELADRGWPVVICAREATELDTAAAWLRSGGRRVVTEVCDVSDRSAVDLLVRRIEERDGPVEVLFSVAGIIQVAPMDSLQHSDFEQAVGTMLWGPVNLTLAVLEQMRRRRSGHIATITSIGGMVSVPHLLPYSTAKFGAVGFSQGLRAELAGSGVSVTTVVPGLMRTGSHLRAQFGGRPEREYAWFATAASLPLVSMDAERAARRIVDRTLRGRAMVVLTPLAWIAIRIHGMAPATTTRLLGLVNRLLPDASAHPVPAVDGRQARHMLRRVPRAVVDAVTRLGERSARRFNEYSG